METETLLSNHYPGIIEAVYCPKWYLTGHSDEYSNKILSSKKIDESLFFIPYLKDLITHLKNLSLLGDVQLITIIPNSKESKYSPTMESLGLWFSDTLHSKFEKVIIPIRPSQKNRNCLNKEDRFKETSGSLGLSRALLPEEKAILLLDDAKASGTTLLESIRILKDAGAKSFCIVCLGINHNPQIFGVD
jgi:predicted amidophosphoribosyltransferase